MSQTRGGSKFGRHQLPIVSSIVQRSFVPSCRPRVWISEIYMFVQVLKATLELRPNADLPRWANVSSPLSRLRQGSIHHQAWNTCTKFADYTQSKIIWIYQSAFPFEHSIVATNAKAFFFQNLSTNEYF